MLELYFFDNISILNSSSNNNNLLYFIIQEQEHKPDKSELNKNNLKNMLKRSKKSLMEVKIRSSR